MADWTAHEITAILRQLDDRGLPFKRYTLYHKGGELVLLGNGASAYVYEARVREKKYSWWGLGGQLLSTLPQKTFAMKVIGFGNEDLDSKSFDTVKNADMFDLNIVGIKKYSEILVWLDDDGHIVDIEVYSVDGCVGEKKTENDTGRKPNGAASIRLRFILMEKLEPIIKGDHISCVKLNLNGKTEYDETEVLKLARDMCNAVSKAHKNNIIHRDIKPENIFYDKQHSVYKLGDFGIAKIAKEGMAKSAVFTKGYCAPEVINKDPDEMYDARVDIYSLGMTLYVLMNNMRFPDSNGYYTKVESQYMKGYVLPRSVNGSDGLYEIVKKMCMFNPNDRYQSVDEALYDIESIIFNDRFSYRRSHKSTTEVLIVILFMGSFFMWKVMFLPLERPVSFTPVWYALIAVSAGKFLVQLQNKSTFFMSAIAFAISAYLLITTRFVVGKLIILGMITFLGGKMAIVAGGFVLCITTSILLQSNIPDISENFREIIWVWIVCIIYLIAIVSDYLHLTVDRGFIKYGYLRYARIYFLNVLAIGVILKYGEEDVLRAFISQEVFNFLESLDLIIAGLVGLCMDLVETVREKYLISMTKKTGTERRR